MGAEEGTFEEGVRESGKRRERDNGRSGEGGNEGREGGREGMTELRRGKRRKVG